MDTGLLLLRVVVGLLFVGHGMRKLFGLFGGPGIEKTGGMMRSLGYPLPGAAAMLAGTTEMIAGALFALGLVTPFAAAGIIAVMVNAIVAVHIEDGLWNTQGGFEFPLVMGTVAAAVAFMGPGDVSLDTALGWDLGSWVWGIVAVVLGLGLGGAAIWARSRRKEIERAARRAA